MIFFMLGKKLATLSCTTILISEITSARKRSLVVFWC